MIYLQFKAGSDQNVNRAIRRKAPQLVAHLSRTMDELMLMLQQKIQRKLSGELLHQRSGKLIGSVQKLRTEVDGRTITGAVKAAGGPAFYGMYLHEGVPHSVEIRPVNKKALAFFPGGAAGAFGGAGYMSGRQLFYHAGARKGTLKPGKAAAFGGLGGVVVQKVTIPPQPARPFANQSLDELRATIISRLYSSAAEAISS